MARVNWTDEAEKDFRIVIGRIAKDSHFVANKWAAKIRKAVKILVKFPEIGSPVKVLKKVGYREIIVGPYRVVYLIDGAVCRISAVVHGERILEPLLEENDE